MRHHALLGGIFGLLAIGACTTFDNLKADPNAVGGPGPGIGSSGTSVAVPNSGTGVKGAQCKGNADCASLICQDGACTDASATDGVKNGTETDIDCGGSAPTNAPKCLAQKVCKTNDDCFWGTCANSVCSGHIAGTKDGDETDVDCGGTQSPACDWNQSCQFDRDCTTSACGPDHTCLVGPSCNQIHGGNTCGTGEFDDATKQHESCCKSLPVTGFTDSNNAGKLVYVDKYEITAGRLRVFMNAISKQDANQVPNVKAWITAHTPTRWNNDWNVVLPEGWEQGEGTYTIASPTTDLQFPGEDQEAVNPPVLGGWSINSGSYTIDTGANFLLGSPHFFPEFAADPALWPEGADYAAGHNLNCTNQAGSFGFSTFWFDQTTVANFSGGEGKGYTQDQMDEKALNCTPFALFAAFCAWDGGQLLTDEAFDFIAGGAWPDLPQNPGVNPPPRLAGGNTQCGPDAAPNTLNVSSDGTLTCDNVYAFPDPSLGGDFDGSSRIAPPGRVPADVVAINAGDEPWHDLIGNLNEGVFRKDGLFAARGYGLGWSSVSAHRTQQTTARFKEGAFGARCMRFRDKPVAH